MLEQPCLNHATPVKHLLKDCRLMKRFLFDGTKKGDARKRDGVGEGDGGP